MEDSMTFSFDSLTIRETSRWWPCVLCNGEGPSRISTS
jgi:hypothetical protein